MEVKLKVKRTDLTENAVNVMYGTAAIFISCAVVQRVFEPA